MERQKIEERVYFNKAQKIKMLEKSKYRCCHCGKSIDIDNDFSVEHVIPISKGGTNEADNLIALCNRCNSIKGNMVYNPSDFYKYLNKKDLKILVDNMRDYIDKFDWFSANNLFPFDAVYFDYYCESVVFMGKRLSGNRAKMPTKKVVLKKAIDNEWYSDYDRVYDFYMEYNIAYGLPVDNLAKYVKSILTKSTCYYLTDENSDKILMLFSIGLGDVSDSQTNKLLGHVLHIDNILVTKDSLSVAYLIYSIIVYMLDSHLQVVKEFNCKGIPYVVTLFDDQPIIANKLIEVFSLNKLDKSKTTNKRFTDYTSFAMIYNSKDIDDSDDEDLAKLSKEYIKFLNKKLGVKI